jgi:tetratricopeptide (TPR) repeat protein
MPPSRAWLSQAVAVALCAASLARVELRAIDLPSNPDILPSANDGAYERQLAGFRVQLDLARRFRQEGRFADASTNLVSLLQSSAPDDLKRDALLELGFTTEAAGDLARAQQILTQYTRRYADDPSVPDVLLRQGLLYRKAGANSMALSKFYAVLTAALRLKADRLSHYQQLVLQAQTQIAETYYLQGQFGSAAEYFDRLLKLDSPALNEEQILYKLIRSLDFTKRDSEVLGHGQDFISKYPQSAEYAEVQFVIAGALKRLGRNDEAAQHVFAMLQRQQAKAADHLADWAYWQKRAGNEIANQMYEEGDYANALAIYSRLAELDDTPAWQWPVLYQVGLVYERLAQPAKASEVYSRIASGAPQNTSTNRLAPGLQTVVDMARWRKDYLAWQTRAEHANAQLRLPSADAPASNRERE